MIHLNVVDGCNEIEAQFETFAPIAIPLAQDTEDLYLANHMFSEHTPASQFAIGNLLFWRERVVLGLLGRGSAVRMQLGQSLITFVRQALDAFRQDRLARFEHLEIVGAAHAKCGADDFFRVFIDCHL